LIFRWGSEMKGLLVGAGQEKGNQKGGQNAESIAGHMPAILTKDEDSRDGCSPCCFEPHQGGLPNFSADLCELCVSAVKSLSDNHHRGAEYAEFPQRKPILVPAYFFARSASLTPLRRK
jgi:hypothetical protein